MSTISVKTRFKKILADRYTPVNIYLRLRDQFPGSVLLESADHNAGENSFSYIAINPIAGIEINHNQLEYKYPNQDPVSESISSKTDIADRVMQFIKSFSSDQQSPVSLSESFFGYTGYEAIRFFETIQLSQKPVDSPEIPLLRYRFYQYVIAIDHFKNELFICENKIDGIESDFEAVEALICKKSSPSYHFEALAEETSNMTDEDYRQLVQKGIAHCQRGDVFQIVFSRRFQQKFKGDEFNVYRALRSINPSPYLFYFDYGSYKLIGSSPESQLVVKDGEAVINPIAGTTKRTGDQQIDQAAIDKLLNDPKENAEHVMLVDLARNDMSRFADKVEVAEYRKVHTYSHVIHLVSKVVGQIAANANPFQLLGSSFPAGTLSGAPKYKAMELIDANEPTTRGYYAGCIGSVGLNGDFNHAIMIRSFLSHQNTLYYQAGAGIVSKSIPENERQEVDHKLNALKQAIQLANTLS